MKRWLVSSVLALSACDGCQAPESVAIEPVATCSRASGDVRRKLYSGAAWRSLTEGAALFPGDWVQTGAAATAEVDYTLGDALLVEPRTTIVIARPAARATEVQRISIKSGTVRGRLTSDPPKRLRVDLPDGRSVRLRADSEATEVRVGVRPDGAAEVAVTEGRAIFETQTGEETIESGTARRVEETTLGAPIALPAAPEPDPAPSRVFEGSDQALTWSPKGEPPAAYEVELSRAPDFSNPIVLSTQIPRVALPALPPGRVYWRVRSVDAEGRAGAASEAGTFEVRVDDRPRLLLSPEDGAEYRISRGTARVEFRWQPPAEEGPVTLELARDGAEPTRRVLEGTSVELRLPPGRYVWRMFDAQAAPMQVDPRTIVVRATGGDLRVPTRLDWE